MENDLQQIDLNHLDLDPLDTPTPKDQPYGYREQSMKYANLALDYFNKSNLTKYELVEDENMHSHPINYGRWFHCNFKAKDSSIEQFFAEIDRVNGSKPVVTTCQVLKDEKHAGCEYCSRHINHPVDGYKVGRPDQYSGKMQDSSMEQFFGEIDKVDGSEPVVTTSQDLEDDGHVGCACCAYSNRQFKYLLDAYHLGRPGQYVSCTYNPLGRPGQYVSCTYNPR